MHSGYYCTIIPKLLAMTVQLARTPWVDALASGRASLLVQILAIVFFAIATAVGAQLRIYLWEIPITLQTLFVYGSGLVLGARNGALSMLLYLLLGMIFPVYAGSGYGLTYLVTATSAGYLLGMPVSAYVIGLLGAQSKNLLGSLFALAAGSVVLFTCGVVWLHYAAAHMNWWYSIEAGWLRFVGFDIAKILMVALSYRGLRQWCR